VKPRVFVERAAVEDDDLLTGAAPPVELGGGDRRGPESCSTISANALLGTLLLGNSGYFAAQAAMPPSRIWTSL